jgi:hypothetical protein
MQQFPLPQLLQLVCGVAVPWLGAPVICRLAQLIVPHEVVAGMQMSTVPPTQTEADTSGALVAQTLTVTVPVAVQTGEELLEIV